MKKVLIIPLVAGFAVLTVTSSASAFGGRGMHADVDLDTDTTDEQQWGMGQHRHPFGGRQQFMGHREEHTAVEAAIEAGDYEAFVAAVGETPMAERISSEADFTKLQALHVARESGDEETAKALAEELGLPGRGERAELRAEHREAVQTAVEAGDYTAFLEAVADGPLAEQIDTEDKFVLFVELHEAREIGDQERVEELVAELGLPEKPQRGQRQGMHQGMKRGSILFDEVEDYEGFASRFGQRSSVQRVTPEAFGLVKSLIEAYDVGDTSRLQAFVQQLKELVQG